MAFSRQSVPRPSACALALSAVLLFAAVLAPPAVRAERLILHNGNHVTGQIESETSDRITLRTTSGRVSFPRSSIASIVRQTPPEQTVALAVEAASRGDLAGALGAPGHEVLPPASRDQLDAALVRLSKTLLGAGTPARADAVRFARYVDQRETSAPASLRLLLSSYQAASGDLPGAVQTLKTLSPEDLQRDPSARQAAAGILSRQIAASLAGGDPHSGIHSLELLARIAPERITAPTRLLLHIAKAQRLAENGAFSSALDELATAVVPRAPVLAWEEANRQLSRAEQQSTVSVLADLYDRMHRHFYPAGFGRELLPVYQRHIAALLLLGRFDEARLVAGKLSRIDADTGAPFEHQIELAARRSELAQDDILGRYRLGVWAREVGLLDEARSLLRSSLIEPHLKENIALQLQLLESETQRRQFEQAAGLFEKRRYEEARKALEAFRSTHQESAYTKKAGELAELARFHLWSSKMNRPAEAEVLRQNAERFFLQARYGEALELLNRLEIEFPGTEAVTRGRTLRDQIQARTGKSGPVVGSAHPPSDLAARRMAEMQAMAQDLARQR